MYIAGGNSKIGAMKDLWRFDIEEGEWRRLQDMSSPRYSFSMHIWNNFIVVFGGCCGDSRSSDMLHDLLFYDIETNSWQIQDIDGDNWPPGRCRQGSCMVNNMDGSAEMYLMGGYTEKKRKDVWKLTLNKQAGALHFKWNELPNLKQQTHRLFSFALDGKVYMVGGFGHSLKQLQVIN